MIRETSLLMLVFGSKVKFQGQTNAFEVQIALFGSKLLYEELQIKFDFRHGWPTFSWVIALCSKFDFQTFLHSAFTYLNESW